MAANQSNPFTVQDLAKTAPVCEYLPSWSQLWASGAFQPLVPSLSLYLPNQSGARLARCHYNWPGVWNPSPELLETRGAPGFLCRAAFLSRCHTHFAKPCAVMWQLNAFPGGPEPLPPPPSLTLGSFLTVLNTTGVPKFPSPLSLLIWELAIRNPPLHLRLVSFT